MSHIRTRSAPSPTGRLHIGGARSALFNYLFAKQQGGAFVLRIEDTDPERSRPEYEENIFESFHWLGIEPDESPEQGGPYGPYRQSERKDRYTPLLEQLLKKEKAFLCHHTETELEEEHRSFIAKKENPIHRCSNRDTPWEKGSEKESVIRFKTPLDRTIVFSDLVRGEVSFASNNIEDFPLARNFSSPLYNFSAAVDDAAMEISHIFRGEEHLSNTPKQILILEAFGFPVPHYAHLPLVLAPDRSKLSKRHGATAVSEFRDAGYLPEAIINFIALLGWNPGDDRELFSLKELIQEFDLGKVQKSGAVFNREKLDWMNGGYIRKKSPRELLGLSQKFLEDFLQLPFSQTQFPDNYLERVVALEQPRLKRLSEIGERVEYFFREPEYELGLLRWKDMEQKDIEKHLNESVNILRSADESDFSKESLERHFLKMIGGGDKGKFLWPLRVALTGKRVSPGPFEIMAILGKQKTEERLSRALEKVRQNK